MPARGRTPEVGCGGVGGHRRGPGEYLKEGRPRRSRDRIQALGERAVEARRRGTGEAPGPCVLADRLVTESGTHAPRTGPPGHACPRRARARPDSPSALPLPPPPAVPAPAPEAVARGCCFGRPGVLESEATASVSRCRRPAVRARAREYACPRARPGETARARAPRWLSSAARLPAPPTRLCPSSSRRATARGRGRGRARAGCLAGWARGRGGGVEK